MSPFQCIVPRLSAISRLLPPFAHARRPTPTLRLNLERLERRTVLSSFNLPVTSLADAGPGTLRSAITAADPGSASHKYSIEIKVSGTITLESALPALSKNMNLTGPGARRLTVEHDPNVSADFGIFVVNSGAAVEITGMTIAGGFTTGSGGGIDNNGTLTVCRMTIDRNSAEDAGGGIYNGNTATLKASHTTIFDNLAEAGGGIFNNGQVTASHMTISGNAGQQGGGVYNNGTFTLATASMLGNQAGFDSPGGGIDNNGTLTLSHTTISHSAATTGGAVYNTGTLNASRMNITLNNATTGAGIDNTSSLSVTHSTIFNNSATTGGGIDNTGTLTVTHSSISHNLATTGLAVYNSGGGQAEIDYSTIDEPGAGGALVNNTSGTGNDGSTIRLKKTVVNGVLYNDELNS